MRVMRSLAVLLMSVPALTPLAAQEWRTGGEFDVVRRAALARSSRDADSVLAGWQARARGVLRFAAVIDHGKGPVERVIRADELEVEVYGEAPSRSKQVIVAWRDTTFQPTSIRYHRDHLGIVANDFGPTIRLGEGDEVRDVPHPLSARGLEWYQFRLGDTVVIRSTGGTIRVASVAVKPRDPAQPGVIGTMLLDIDRATLVRLQFTFTAAAYRDPTVSAITVSLESALHGQSHWLPWRQSIAIHRASPMVALPLSTVIRADWTIDHYQLGVVHPPGQFQGSQIDGLRAPGGTIAWDLSWRERLDQSPPSDAELDAIAEQATQLLAAGLLDGLPRLRLLATQGVSGVLRVDRVQGVTVGAGFRVALRSATRLELAAAVGTASGEFTGTAAVSRILGPLRVGIRGGSTVDDVIPWARRSGVLNSVATALSGDDAGDWARVESVEGWLERIGAGLQRLAVGWQAVEPVVSQFTALDGTRNDNPAFAPREGWLVEAGLGSHRDGDRGWQLNVEAGTSNQGWLRAMTTARSGGPLGSVWRIDAGWGSTHLPADRGFVIGGAGSLAGTVPRSLSGRRAVRVELGWPVDVHLPAPFWSAALSSRLSPFVAAGWAGGALTSSPWGAASGVHSVVGLRADLWGPLLRVETGWAPRTGGLSLSIDAHPDWWPLL